MVVIDKIRFQDEYTGVLSGGGSDTGTDFLLGAVGDMMWVEIDFHVIWSSQDIPMTFSIADGTITRNDFGSFIQDGFVVDNDIEISNAGGNDGDYIIETVTDSVITVSSTLGEDGTFGSVSIFGTNDIDYIDFYYNLIANGNSESFRSLSDVNTQRLSNVTAIPESSSVNLVPATKQYAWNDVPKDEAKIYGVTTYAYPTYGQYFKIICPFFIKPFFLNGQTQSLKDLLNEINVTPPDYFKDLSCLQFIYRIDARYTQRDPTVYHTSDPQTFKLGNTAWFNEKLDGDVLEESGIVQYKLLSNSYYDAATSYPVSTIDYEGITDVIIYIQTPNGSVITEMDFVVNFMWLPSSPEAYQNKGISDFTNDFGEPNDYRHLFLHDRAKQGVGGGSVNGDRYGTDYQVLKNVIAVQYGTEIIVGFQIDMGSKVKEVFESNQYGRDFMIWVTPQSGNVSTLIGTDRVAVLCDVNTATTDTDDDTLLVVDTEGTSDVHFFRSPSTTNPYTNVSGFIGEYWMAQCGFKVKSGCTVQNINVNIQVDVIDGDGNETHFPLEQWLNVTDKFYNGIFTDISIQSNQNFFLSDESPFMVRSIQRDLSLDGGGFYGYELNYGFQLGYGWWDLLNNFAKQFETYRNQYWAVYTQNQVVGGNPIQVDGGSASIKFIISWDILDNSTGIVTQFDQTCNINTYDKLTNYITSITTQDAIFGDDLSQQVADDIQTQVTAIFSGTNIGVPPSGQSIIVEFSIYYQDGSINRYDMVSNFNEPLEGSLWINTPDYTIDSNDQVTATATLNIDKKNINIIYAKIGYNLTDGLLTDDGIQIQTDDGVNITVD